MQSTPSVAVLIPCRDEELTIGKVVADFRHALPEATIWVCDNGSRDDTAARARAAGARVLAELRPGKGNAVRALFTVASADVLLLVDGDDTYDAASAPEMIAVLDDQHCEMAIARRITALQQASDAYRRGHQWGNRMFAWAISGLFGYRVEDVFSGYRAFTKRFVRSFPALSRGFEIETELTVHALDLGLRVREIESAYSARPHGSSSKLNTFRDGRRIALAILHLYEQMHPARFFGVLGIGAALISLALGVPVVVEFAKTGLVPRLPSAVLAAALMLLAALVIGCGVILDSIGRGRREAKRLAFLAIDTELKTEDRFEPARNHLPTSVPPADFP
jgi:glycosyltransferase involved in cell wall biosynthesis